MTTTSSAGVLLLLALHGCEGFASVSGAARPAAAPRLAVLRAQASGDAFDAPIPPSSDLIAQGGERRIAVSGLTPDAQSPQQQQGEEGQYVGVPPPGYEPTPPPTFMQKAKSPFIGLTLLATAGVASWQSKRMYAQRQEALLADFGETMVFHLGDEREMATALKDFRAQLGPGRYTSKMFLAYLKAHATTVPIGVKGIQSLKTATALFRLSDSALAPLLESAANELSRQPSVLGKLTFMAERAMPMPASMAKLRSKFPNWSFDTVTALQRAMLENLYRDLIEPLSADTSPDATTLEVLGLSEADASRLMAEVQERKAAEIREAEEKAAEELQAARLQRALEEAAQDQQMRTRVTSPPPSPSSPTPTDSSPTQPSTPSPSAPTAVDDDEPEIVGASGTHEFECTKCGYVLFPAAGREFKFFGDDFTCPQSGCGASKDEFVDNGPVD